MLVDIIECGLVVVGGAAGAGLGLLGLRLGKGRRRKPKRGRELDNGLDFVGILPPVVEGSIESQVAHLDTHITD